MTKFCKTAAAILIAAMALSAVFVGGATVRASAAEPSDAFYLNKIAEFSAGMSDADGGIAEIVRYNTDNDKLYLVNGKTKTVDIVSVSEYGDGELQTAFDESADRISFGELESSVTSDVGYDFTVGDITSVDVNTDLDVIAVALQHSEYDKKGAVALLGYDGEYIKAYEAGVQPDMILFAGDKVLTANEGEPREGYVEGTADPAGSVTVVDLSAGEESGVARTVGFEAFDDRRDELAESGVIIKKGADPSVDFEPEYIAVEGNAAYIALQEANAIATLDLENNKFVSVLPLGFKDYGARGNELDLIEDGKAELKTEAVLGAYMPDGIDTFVRGGETYIVTANEGDAREWGDYEGVEKYEIYDGNKIEVLKNSEWDGLASDRYYLLGGRSFSVFRASDMSLVYDSGSAIESAIAGSDAHKAYFNCSNDDTDIDSRSKKKGPEPEAVKVAPCGDALYAYVALERQGGIMAFDITDLSAVALVTYESTRDYSEAIKGDVAPESIDYVPAADNPSGKDLVIAANEVSGTVALYAAETERKTYEMHENYVSAPAEQADHMLINKVYGSGGKADQVASSHDFISLLNPTAENVSVEGWTLEYSVSDGGEREWQTLTLDAVIPAGGEYVILGAACDNEETPYITFGEGEYNVVWEGLSIDNKHYSLRLVDADGDVADALGVINTEDGETDESGEGSPLDDISKNKVAYRTGATDTDDNATDFDTLKIESAADAAKCKPVACVPVNDAPVQPDDEQDGEQTETPAAGGGCGSVTAGGTGYMMIGLSVVIAVAFAVMLAARRRGKDK